MAPPLLILADQAAYQQHYVGTLCGGPLIAFDGIPVFFDRHRFYHAFFETVVFKDDTFSDDRAQRMDWIRATLQDPLSDRYQGWNAQKKAYEPHRRVEVVHDDFVVVLQIGKKVDGQLKARFVTCFNADRSINSIRRSPAWNRQACENAL